MLAQLFSPPPRLADLAPEQAAIVTAARRWVMAQRHERRCPLQAAAGQLGCVQAARALHMLLSQAGFAWPDPIAIAPPCCGVLTHDEATILGLVLAAHHHGRPVFDALLCEMLGQDARDRLFATAVRLGALLEA
jgi:hypothetical protein